MKKQTLTQKFNAFEKRLSYKFSDRSLLLKALKHSDVIGPNGKKKRNVENRRLELLGDRAIDLAIIEILMTLHPKWDTNQLSKTKASYVNNNGPLAKIARALGLGDLLILKQKQRAQKMHENTKVLSDTVEALFGAISQDCGSDKETITELVKKHWVALGLLNVGKKRADYDLKLSSEYEDLPITWQQHIDNKLCIALFPTKQGGTVADIQRYLKLGGDPNKGYMTYQHYPAASPYRTYLENVVRSNRSDRVEVVKLLLDYGAHPNAQKFYKPNVNYKVLSKTLYEELNVRDSFYENFLSMSPLHHLVEAWTVGTSHRLVFEDLEIAKVLIEKGARLSWKNEGGFTPFEDLEFRIIYIEACIHLAIKKRKLHTLTVQSIQRDLKLAKHTQLASTLYYSNPNVLYVDGFLDFSARAARVVKAWNILTSEKPSKHGEDFHPNAVAKLKKSGLMRNGKLIPEKYMRILSNFNMFKDILRDLNVRAPVVNHDYFEGVLQTPRYQPPSFLEQAKEWVSSKVDESSCLIL